MRNFHSEIKPAMKICDSCRKQVAKAKKEKIDKDIDLDVEEQNLMMMMHLETKIIALIS